MRNFVEFFTSVLPKITFLETPFENQVLIFFRRTFWSKIKSNCHPDFRVLKKVQKITANLGFGRKVQRTNFHLSVLFFFHLITFVATLSSKMLVVKLSNPNFETLNFTITHFSDITKKHWKNDAINTTNKLIWKTKTTRTLFCQTKMYHYFNFVSTFDNL